MIYIFLLALSPLSVWMQLNYSYATNISLQSDHDDNIIVSEYVQIHNILKSYQPLYLDISVYITPDACRILDAYHGNNRSIVAEILFEATKMFMVHNIVLTIQSIQYCTLNVGGLIGDKMDLNGYGQYFTSINSKFDASLIFEDFSSYGILGWATIGKICTPHAVAIVQLPFQENTLYTAEVVVHELGHTFGFNHANYNPACPCGMQDSRYCMMSSPNFAWYGKFPKTFEVCWMRELFERIDSLPCLQKPMKGPRLNARCGDGILDKGEECDCGSSVLCNTLTREGECCDPTSCKFRNKRFKCSGGKCCRQCKFMKNTVCRQSADPCDISDFCQSDSYTCGTDRTKKDYSLCENYQGFCLKGKCINMDSICQQAYGTSTVFYSPECVTMLKTMMDKKCHQPTNDHEFNHLICSQHTDVCDHFVCGIPRVMKIPDTLYFYDKGHYCILPKKKARMGLLQRAPDYMICSDGDSTQRFCVNGQCVAKTRSLNCKTGVCYQFKEKIVASNASTTPRKSYSRDILNEMHVFEKENFQKFFAKISPKPKTSSRNDLEKKIICGTLCIALTVVGVCTFIGLFILLLIYLRRRRSNFQQIRN